MQSNDHSLKQFTFVSIFRSNTNYFPRKSVSSVSSNVFCRFWITINYNYIWISVVLVFDSRKLFVRWCWYHNTEITRPSLREKCPNMEFFLVRIFLCSVRIQKNMDQTKLRIWTIFTQCLIKNSIPKF